MYLYIKLTTYIFIKFFWKKVYNIQILISKIQN